MYILERMITMTNIQNQNIQEETLTWGNHVSITETIVSEADRHDFNEAMMAWGNRASFSDIMKASGRYSDADVEKVKQEEANEYDLRMLKAEQEDLEKQAQWTY